MKKIAITIGIAVIALGAGAALYFSKPTTPSETSELMPDDIAAQLASLNPEQQTQLDSKIQNLAKEYPRDPRMDYILAQQKATKADYEGAATQLRSGLEKAEKQKLLGPSFGLLLQVALLNMLTKQNKMEEAKKALQAICDRFANPDGRELLEAVESKELRAICPS